MSPAIVLAVLVATVVGMSMLLESADDRWLFTGLIYAVIVTFAGIGFIRWRTGVLLFFIWIGFEDLVRKYHGNDLIVYAVKDVLVLAAYVGYVLWQRRSKEKVFRNPVLLPMLAVFAWALIEALNPSVDRPLSALVGLRMWFLYVPMMYLGYAFFRHDRGLRRFLVAFLLVGAVIGILGILQATIGLDFLNPEEPLHNTRLQLVRFFGENFGEFSIPRPNSTFLDASRFAVYMFGMFYLGLGSMGYLYSIRKRSRTYRMPLLIFLFWAVAFAALFISGQRAVLVWIAFTIPLFLLARLLTRRYRAPPGTKADFPLKQIVTLSLVCGLLFALLLPQQLGLVTQFYEERLSPTSPLSDLGKQTYVWKSVTLALDDSVLGHGTGMNSLGRQYVIDVNPYDPLDPNREALGRVEGGYAAVAWEWGLVGLGLWAWMTIALLSHMWRRLRHLARTPYFWFGVSVIAYTFFILVAWFGLGFQVYQNYVAQSLLWFLVGVYFKMADTAKESRPSTEEQPQGGTARGPLGLHIPPAE